MRSSASLLTAYGLEPDYDVPGDFRPGDVRHLVHDASRIRALGWEPQTSLDDGFAEVVAWISGLGELREYFSDALERLRAQGVVMRSTA